MQTESILMLYATRNKALILLGNLYSAATTVSKLASPEFACQAVDADRSQFLHISNHFFDLMSSFKHQIAPNRHPDSIPSACLYPATLITTRIAILLALHSIQHCSEQRLTLLKKDFAVLTASCFQFCRIS